LLFAKLVGTRIVYVDVMFDIPKNRFKHWLYTFCLNRAKAVISYSAAQSSAWSKEFRVPNDKMLSAHYPIDSAFYRKPEIESSASPYVIAVGRDTGRDFSTLLEGTNIAGIDVKIVTLPYLLPPSCKESSRVEVFQRLSYPDLFKLYAQARLAVVPLKSNMVYPSGTRALLEAMLLKIPVIASNSSVFAEDFVDGEHLLYFKSEEPTQLADAIKRLVNDPDLATRLVENAWQKVITDFGVDQFADTVERVLVNLKGVN